MPIDIRKLVQCIQPRKPQDCLYIAYSGGLDSRLLAHIAQKSGINVHLLHCTGPHIAPMDTRYARQWAQERGLALTVFDTNPLLLPTVAAGSKERCYACKHSLFSLLLQHIDGKMLYDGTNHSDKQKFRPGMRALQELGIVSPFALCDIDKDTIRRLAVESKLENPEQQARPCLLTRFSYDTPPTLPTITRIAAAEEALYDYCMQSRGTQKAFDFRLRYVDGTHFALHITTEDNILHEKERRAIQEILSQHTIDAPIELMHTLSGFFDTRLGLQKT